LRCYAISDIRRQTCGRGTRSLLGKAPAYRYARGSSDSFNREPTKVHYEEEAWARLTTEQFLAKVIGGTAIGDTTQENLSKVKEKIQQIFASI